MLGSSWGVDAAAENVSSAPLKKKAHRKSERGESLRANANKMFLCWWSISSTRSPKEFSGILLEAFESHPVVLVRICSGDNWQQRSISTASIEVVPLLLLEILHTCLLICLVHQRKQMCPPAGVNQTQSGDWREDSFYRSWKAVGHLPSAEQVRRWSLSSPFPFVHPRSTARVLGAWKISLTSRILDSTSAGEW